jgi:hypothetical protein
LYNLKTRPYLDRRAHGRGDRTVFRIGKLNGARHCLFGNVASIHDMVNVHLRKSARMLIAPLARYLDVKVPSASALTFFRF